MTTFVSYMFRLLPNDTNPIVTTYSGCEGKREIALGDVSRIIYLDPNHIQEILDLIKFENQSLSNAFQGWKQCSVTVITDALDLLKGSICWYPYPKFIWNSIPPQNYVSGSCRTFFTDSLLNNTCEFKNSDPSKCFDPVANYTVLSTSRSTPSYPNGICNSAFYYIDDTISAIYRNATQHLLNMYTNLSQGTWVSYDTAPNCSTIPDNIVNMGSDSVEDPRLSTTTIVLVSVASTVIFGAAAFTAYKLLTKRKTVQS